IKQGNRNALLYTDPSVDGLKTGHTDEAGYCLTTSSKRGPMRLISVIFGTPSMSERADQTRALLAWGFANFETANVQPANQVLAKAKVWFGKENEVQVGLAENFNVTMPKGKADGIKTQLVVQPNLSAPLQKGQVVGKLVAGMPAEGHYSTAKDMAVLAQHIIKDSSKYYPIYSEKEFTFNGIKQGNRNALLYTDPSVDGLKTGHTDEAGYCLTTSSKRGPMRLISVIFGTPSMSERADQTRALLAWGFANFETANVQPANQVLAKAKVWFGKENEVQVGLAENFNVTMPKGKADGIKTQLVVQPNLNAPLQKGQVVGKLVASLDGKVIAEKPLVALKPVEEAGFFARLIDHIKQFFSNLF
ncbi:hypothetical protein CTY75_20265, partial [Acinetobacter baumannii]|nr:hypothetical protein [Acinetobacter baumannii]